MDFDKLKQQATNDEKSFVKDFGYNLMTVSREELPELIGIALKTNNELLKKKILNNTLFLIKKVRVSYLGNLLSVLFQDPLCYKKVADNFNYLADFFTPNNIEIVVNAFLSMDKNSQLLADNFETIIESAKTDEQIQRIMESVKHISKCNIKIQVYNSIVSKLGNYSFLKCLNPGTMLKLAYNNKLDYVKSIFDQYSNGDLKKIKFLAKGFTSTVFTINNDKVIKIGKKRVSFNIPFSKYILQPYHREELRDANSQPYATIEIQDFCTTNDITDKEFEDFTKKVSDSGIVWHDSDKKNVFRLLKDNGRKILPLEDGFTYANEKDISGYNKAGNLIIGDTDLIYTKEDALLREDSFKTPAHQNTFSLVLPTYNMEKYLEKCLNSILNQTCNDFEVIIVNDGSKDSSEEIAKKYASMDSRFKVYNFENGGLSTARNRGLKLATGKYILFIDPDDAIEPELLEKLQPYVKSNIETVRFSAVVENEPQKDKYRFNRPFYPNVTSGVEALKLWNNDKRYSTAWLYCIKKDVYNRCEFQFPPVEIYEDVASVPKLIANSNTVAMLDYIGYDYIQHDTSITNTKKANKALFDLTGFMKAYDFINEAMTEFFKRHPDATSDEIKNEILNGFFIRLENKFKTTKVLDKDLYARQFFSRNRLFHLDYKPQKYFAEAPTNPQEKVFYNTANDVSCITYIDTTISRLGEYTYSINGRTDTVELYRVEKLGNHENADSFLCMSKIDFSKLLSNQNYKEMVFKYLLSYTNLFLAESLNGGYIGNIKVDGSKFSIDFDPNCTQFARSWRSNVPKIENKDEER